MAGERDGWIFAYGSLMWRPDFPFVERCRARLPGYHRALCIVSHHWRGTPEQPGLVFGLDRGGSCVGLAFRVAAADVGAVLTGVRARELVTDVYREVAAPVRLADRRRVTAFAYVADRRHPQYAGRPDRAVVLARVRGAAGVAGPNIDYVRATYAHLVELGVADPDLAALVAALEGEDAPGPACGRTARKHLD